MYNIKLIIRYKALFFVHCREERLNFIRAKYVDKRFAVKLCNTEYELLRDLEDAVNNGELNGVLQAFAENVDFGAPLPHSVSCNYFHVNYYN